MSNNSTSNSISSDYCLKSIFSYIDYNNILTLIKYNKNDQNKSDINLNNYKKIFNFKYVKRNIQEKNSNANNGKKYDLNKYLYSCLFGLIIFINAFIYSLILSKLFSSNHKAKKE